MRICIYKKIHYLTFDIDLGVKVTRNVTQYPLHHVIYASTKFEVAMPNGLGEDTITRNVTDKGTDRQTDRQTHGQTTDRLWYEINIPYFSNKKKAGIIIYAKYSIDCSEIFGHGVNNIDCLFNKRILNMLSIIKLL